MNFQMEYQLGAYAANIYSPAKKTRSLFDQQLTAPFDTYVLDAFVFIVDTTTNQSVPIIRFAAADPSNHFITRFTDVATTSRFTYDAGGSLTMIGAESRGLEFPVRGGSTACIP